MSGLLPDIVCVFLFLYLFDMNGKELRAPFICQCAAPGLEYMNAQQAFVECG